MPRFRLGVPITILTVVVLLAAGVLAARFASPRSISPSRPALPPPFPVTYAAPEPVYTGSHIWYNFTLNVSVTNITWQELRFFVVPGPLTKSERNWTLDGMNRSYEIVAAYEGLFGNWSTSSAVGVRSGDVAVLETDSPLTLGSFGVTGAWYGVGAYSVELR